MAAAGPMGRGAGAPPPRSAICCDNRSSKKKYMESWVNEDIKRMHKLDDVAQAYVISRVQTTCKGMLLSATTRNSFTF